MAKSTDLIVVLDRSGSMESTKKDAIGGFNSFVEGQKKACETGGDATLTLIQFDNHYEVIYSAKNIKEVQPLTEATFVPRGGTALRDAIGRTLSDVTARLKKIKKEFRPDVVMAIITDGGENSSTEYTPETVNEQIAKARKKGWQIMFIGANQDAINVASSYGIAASSALTYAANAAGTAAVFESLNDTVAMYRTSKFAAPDSSVFMANFSETDRQKQEKAGA